MVRQRRATTRSRGWAAAGRTSAMAVVVVAGLAGRATAWEDENDRSPSAEDIEGERAAKPRAPRRKVTKRREAEASWVPWRTDPADTGRNAARALLERASLRIETLVPLAYRRVELPPGPYRVEVVEREEGRYELRFFDGDAATPRADEAASTPRDTDSDDEETAPAPEPRLRIPLRDVVREEPTDRVTVELSVDRRGERLEIALVAASTKLAAKLRLVRPGSGG